MGLEANNHKGKRISTFQKPGQIKGRLEEVDVDSMQILWGNTEKDRLWWWVAWYKGR